VLTSEQQIEEAAATGTPAVLHQMAVDGSFLAELLSGLAGKALHPKGLYLTGVRIVGCDWAGQRFRTSVSLIECSFDGPVLGQGMRVDGDLKIVDSTCPGLDLSGARIEGNCVLNGTRVAPHSNILAIAANLELVRVSGDIFMEGFEATGEVSLNAAEIGGRFDCGRATFCNPTGDALSADNATIQGGVFLTDFNATGKVRLLGATIGGVFQCERVTLRNDTGDALSADGATVQGGASFTDFNATGEVRLLGATIGGDFQCERVTFRNDTGDALSADNATIKGSVSFTDFNATGEVRLLRVAIGGPFFTKGATFRSETGDALSVDSATIKGGMFLTDDFEATGRVSLVGAETTWLECWGARFDKGRNKKDVAFDARNLTVNGNILAHLKDRPGNLETTGEVDFSLMTVRGQVRLSGASLDNQHGNALLAVGMTVSGELLLDESFRASGTVNLAGASIGDSFVCEHATLDGGSGLALQARNLKVTNRLVLKATVSGSVDLTEVRAGELDDVPSAWPTSGLNLTGFVYGQLSEHASSMGVGKRLEWIRLQTSKPGGYAPQPYSQLAKVYRANGLDDEVRRTLIAKQRDLRRFGTLTRWAKAWNAFLGALIGHGYRPWRAGIAILVIYIASVGIVWNAQVHNDLIPVGSTAVGQAHLTARYCTDRYPCVSPLAYPVDAAIPLINLQQADYWQLNASTAWGEFARGWIDLATVLGWGLTTMLAVALSGLIREG
jgi:hypothetical protein